MADTRQAPETIQRGLRQFDPRLRVVWNTHYRVWQVEEFLAKSGAWSHVMYWCDLEDGQWNRRVFRELPGTAAPLIAEIQKRDVTRAERGGDVLRLARKLDAQGATERARMAVEFSKERKRKFEAFDKEMRRWAPKLVSLHNLGGNSARRAHAERMAIRRDLRIGSG